MPCRDRSQVRGQQLGLEHSRDIECAFQVGENSAKEIRMEQGPRTAAWISGLVTSERYAYVLGVLLDFICGKLG